MNVNSRLAKAWRGTEVYRWLPMLVLLSVTGCSGPRYDTLEGISSDAKVRLVITYPAELAVGDYANIAVSIENDGDVDWVFDGAKGGREGYGALMYLTSSETLGSDFYFSGLKIVGIEPPDCVYYTPLDAQIEALLETDGQTRTAPGECAYYFLLDGSYGWIAFASVDAGETATAELEVLASEPGLYRARVSALGGRSSPRLEAELVTRVD